MKSSLDSVLLVLAILSICTLLVVGAMGCGSSETSERPADTWHYIAVPVPDGRPVVCVTNDLEDALSCDWSNR